MSPADSRAMLGGILGGILDWMGSVMELGWWGLPIFLGIGAALGATAALVLRRTQQDIGLWAVIGALFGLGALLFIWLWMVFLLVVAALAASGGGSRGGRRSTSTKKRRSGGALDAGLSPGAGPRRRDAGRARGGKGGGSGGDGADGGDA